MAPPAIVTWAVGPGLIVLQCFLQLAPKFIVSNALLVDGRGDQELVLRRNLAEAIVVVMALDMAWNALRPKGLTQHTTGLMLIVATTLTAINTLLAYGALVGGGTGGREAYTPSVAFWLQVAAGTLAIPVNQHTAMWRLGESRSPVRMRVVGWIVTVCLGTLALLIPTVATAWPTILLSAAFPAFVGVALVVTHNHAWDVSTPAGEAAVQAAARRKQSAALGVPLWPTMVHYLLLACVCGTNAEAINDMATGLCVRANQLQGKTGLALTNNVSVLLAQLLALGSESGISKWAAADERKRALGFLAVWSASQLARTFGMWLLEEGGVRGSTALAVFVFIDKYTGPLGQAALDTASVSLLQAEARPMHPKKKKNGAEAANSSGGADSADAPEHTAAEAATGSGSGSKAPWLLIPATFLMTIRDSLFRFERPFWEVLLISWPAWNWQLVVSTFVLVGGTATSHALFRYVAAAHGTTAATGSAGGVAAAAGDDPRAAQQAAAEHDRLLAQATGRPQDTNGKPTAAAAVELKRTRAEKE